MKLSKPELRGWVLGFALAHMSLSAGAETNVSIEHQLWTETPAGDTTSVSLDVAVRNTGVSTLDSLVVRMIGPVTVLDESTAVLDIGTMPPGAEVNSTMDFQVHETEQVSSIFGGELYFTVDAVDDSGANIHYEITSAGGIE